jgi:hypothetical protein
MEILNACPLLLNKIYGNFAASVHQILFLASWEFWQIPGVNSQLEPILAVTDMNQEEKGYKKVVMTCLKFSLREATAITSVCQQVATRSRPAAL